MNEFYIGWQLHNLWNHTRKNLKSAVRTLNVNRSRDQDLFINKMQQFWLLLVLAPVLLTAFKASWGGRQRSLVRSGTIRSSVLSMR